MKLEIITPEQTYFTGEVTSVTLPGESGLFSVWEDHAPLISSLKKGQILYISDNNEKTLDIKGGFVEIHQNTITVCLEVI